LSNNAWPREITESRFKLFQERQSRENEMQRFKRANEN
jgi:hypothetical protein